MYHEGEEERGKHGQEEGGSELFRTLPMAGERSSKEEAALAEGLSPALSVLRHSPCGWVDHRSPTS